MDGVRKSSYLLSHYRDNDKSLMLATLATQHLRVRLPDQSIFIQVLALQDRQEVIKNN